jgi:hypothetical protein
MINSSDMNLLYFNLDGQYYVIRYYLYDNIKVIYHNSIAYIVLYSCTHKRKPTLTKKRKKIFKLVLTTPAIANTLEYYEVTNNIKSCSVTRNKKSYLK